MSRLDIFTAVIVVICVGAILFLLYKTTDLFGPKDRPMIPDPQEEQADDGLYDDDEAVADYSDDPYYQSDDLDYAGEYQEDTTDLAGAPAEGIDPMEEEAVEKKEPVKEPAAPKKTYDDLYDSPGVGDYLVLAGTFQYMANAESHAARLKKKGYDEAKVVLFDRGKYATVLVDRFEAYGDASALVSKLEGDQIEAYTHKKRASR
jgi:hypothetical protein